MPFCGGNQSFVWRLRIEQRIDECLLVAATELNHVNRFKRFDCGFVSAADHEIGQRHATERCSTLEKVLLVRSNSSFKPLGRFGDSH
jgi:hypothetical protein